MVAVTGLDDSADRLSESEPVTDDHDDTAQSAVPQSEATDSSTRTFTSADSTTLTRSQRSYRLATFVARCRFCRAKFKEHRIAERHEGRCGVEPLSQCRYCGETHTRGDDPDIHLKTCEAYKSAKKRLEEEVESHAADADGTAQPAGKDEHFARTFIDPQPHEFHAYLKWNCEDLDNPLRSYFGLRSLQGEHDFEKHGRLRTSTEIDETDYNVEFGFKSCGIAPRATENFRLDEVREYLVYVYPKGYNSWGDARAEARKRAYFRISPRWPDIETKKGSKSMSNPYDLEGYDVEVEGSNWDFEQYPTVLRRSLDALAERQGFRFNSPTPIHPSDFDENRLHKSSNIVDAELYVRVRKGKTGRVIAYDGTLHKISLLLAGDREGYTKSIRDDRGCPGYYHTATIDSRRAGELVGDHELSKEFKHYYMRNPDAVEGTALENPKIGVSFQNSINEDTLYWHDLDTLVTELDEALLNVLNWSNIPTRPDSQMFVADDYFEVTGSRRWRKILPDRLPRIEVKQDNQIFAAAAQMNETDTELIETLLTDGGETSPRQLSETIGVHLDTVYRALKRLTPLVDHTYGEVQLGSKYIAQELTGYIDAVSNSIKSGLENTLDGLARAETHGDDNDPWSRWLDRYGGEISRTEGCDPDNLDLGYQPSELAEARQILRNGAFQWSKVTGEKLRRFGFAFAPKVTLVDGHVYQPSRFADALGTPG